VGVLDKYFLYRDEGDRLTRKKPTDLSEQLYRNWFAFTLGCPNGGRIINQTEIKQKLFFNSIFFEYLSAQRLKFSRGSARSHRCNLIAPVGHVIAQMPHP